MPSESIATNPFLDIFEQYIVDAAFLWVLRRIALNQPHYLLSDVQELEQRIETNIDGLLTAQQDVWPLCEDALALEEPGEVFVAGVIAFLSLEIKNIQRVVDVAVQHEEALPGLVSALAWLPDKIADTWIDKFLRSKDLNHKLLAIAACIEKKQDPGKALEEILLRADCQAYVPLYSISLRLVGELKCIRLAPALAAAMQSEDDSVRFWASHSALLMGERSAAKNLEPFIASPCLFQEAAVSIYFRVAPPEYARSVISTLAQQPENTRAVIKACAVLGDPQVVSWLIGKMADSDYAKVCGEAFAQITGIQLEENNLALDIPEIDALESDENDDIDMDEDENLPWPNKDKVAAVWQKYAREFKSNTRYMLGQPISSLTLNQYLTTCTQRLRHAANLELALREQGASRCMNRWQSAG